jgi:hypothetical protein
MIVETVHKNSVGKPQSHILSQYRNFTAMESYLQEPNQFKDQSMFPLNMNIKQHLVDRCGLFKKILFSSV